MNVFVSLFFLKIDIKVSDVRMVGWSMLTVLCDAREQEKYIFNYLTNHMWVSRLMKQSVKTHRRTTAVIRPKRRKANFWQKFKRYIPYMTTQPRLPWYKRAYSLP